jgi:hypothetical protein
MNENDKRHLNKGRPKVENSRIHTVSFCLSLEEKDKLKRLAASSNKSISAFITDKIFSER